MIVLQEVARLLQIMLPIDSKKGVTESDLLI